MSARRPHYWSLTAQVLLLVFVFLAVPAILYSEFQAADRAKASLVLASVKDQGRIIAEAVEPLLTLEPDQETRLDTTLAKLAGPGIIARVLFRPSVQENLNSFFYIASSRQMSAEQVGIERDLLARQGVLQHLNSTCKLDTPMILRYRSADGVEEMITALLPVLNAAGCWAVVTSYSDPLILASSLGQPYWNTTEIRLAAAIYIVSALLVLGMLLRLWRNLRRFSAVARDIGRGGSATGFADQNRIPELADVAREFDMMVEHLRLLSSAVADCPSAILIIDAERRIEYANPAFCALTGFTREEMIGNDTRQLRSPQTPAEHYAELWETISRGEIWRGELCNFKKSGEEYWALVSISSLRGPDGRIKSHIVVQEDITERKRSERQKAMLMAELNHRVKNSLATVKSIATYMLRQNTTFETFKHRFEARLQALAQAHDLLTQTNWEGAALTLLVSRALDPFGREKSAAIDTLGPDLMMPPRAALALSMTFHELATNAAKYGALSTSAGRVGLTWAIECEGDAERLVITWCERGGPTVVPPTHRGFGTLLIERGPVYELDAEVSLSYSPNGLECAVRIPWPINAELGSANAVPVAVRKPVVLTGRAA